MKNSKSLYILFLMAAVTACSPFGKLYKEKARVSLALPAKQQSETVAVKRDTAQSSPVVNFTLVNSDGEDVPESMAVEWDSLHNENLTTMLLDEVVVTAGTTRNTAERNGLINVEFVVTVPKALQQNNWMLNVRPVLMRGEQPDSLKELRFSGLQFRESQERDYRQYDRFLEKIIPDSVNFFRTYVDYRSFERYLERLQWRKHGFDKLRSRHLAKYRKPDPLLQRFSFFNSQSSARDSLLREAALARSQRMLDRLQWRSGRTLARLKDTGERKVLRADYSKGRAEYFNEKSRDRQLYYSAGVDQRMYGPRFAFFNEKMERMDAALYRRYSSRARSKGSASGKGVKYLRALMDGHDMAETASIVGGGSAPDTNKRRYEKIRGFFPMYHFRRPDTDSLFVPRKPEAALKTRASRRDPEALLASARRDSAATVQHYMDRYAHMRSLSPRYTMRRELANPHSSAQWHAERIAKYTKLIDRINSLDTTALVKQFYNTQKIARNEARKAAKDEKFKNIVRFPYNPEAQLDTVIYATDKVQFLYSQKVPADENSSRMKVFVVGNVLNRSGGKYALPKSDTLTYLVSSMTKFIDKTPHFVRKIVTRDAEANISVNFNFPQNKFQLDETNQENRQGMRKLKGLTLALMTDPVYLIDSLALFATSSPEGNWKVNGTLARKRAESIRSVLSRDFKQLYDSLVVSAAVEIDESGRSVRREVKSEIPDLPELIGVHVVPEDWGKLRRLVLADDNFKGDKEAVLDIIDGERDPDHREWLIKSRHKAEYAYMFDNLYPAMRAVDFRFSLSRKGMKQDTIYTNEPDTAYARGIDWLEKRKYEKALEILRPYEDVNTAIAYMSVGYDKAALRILKNCPQAAETKYMEAVLYARLGDEQEAVSLLLEAAEMERAMQSRANLDPELSALVKKYKLFEEDDSVF